ncbi:Na+/H+ antiporter NhaC family protein [Anaerosporobacter faecicola]|uniref:Na+/H+ antiporter NhaC family protein n=1 Tax=Anaerosporobacter faecicola TaxID=2718714 RepID=UPI00143BCD40|nr:Na+/H+ antiporter NhaC family protein [Anaerosporobacter faecicola]
MDVLEAANYGLLSILPPLIAIILALLTKEVITSLLTGILVGALIYGNGNILDMLVTTFEVMGEKMGENVYILIFLALLGALVAVVTMGGGSAAYGAMAANKIKSRKMAALATSALGCFIFIDDYFNCLTVGTVMKPLTDKHRISRAKLAYLIDATAAPICIIAPVSSWGASVATYIQDAGAGNGMSTFIKIIPYNLYAILTIMMVLIICLTNVNFGPMAVFEKNAMDNGDVFSGKPIIDQEERKEKAKGTVIDLVIPILSLIVFTVLAMAYTGGGFTGEQSFFSSFGYSDSSLSLVLGSFGALVLTFFQYAIRKILSFREFMEGISDGVKSMVPAFLILILAWTIGGICSTEYLNTGGYVGNLVQDANFPLFILPVMVFVIAAFLGFATGTSWGTMALLIPIGAAICSSPSTSVLLYPVLGAVLAGSVYGDHISPISDTTILSSTGAGCNHMDHVSTQLAYASVVASSCVVGYILMGIMKTILVPFIIAICVLFGLIYILNRRSQTR